MSSRLYKREAELLVYRTVAGQYFSNKPNAVEIKDLRMSFAVEKTLGKTPNSCSVHVYNCAPQTRSAFQRKPLHVILTAGYEGNMARVFEGDVRWVGQSHNGVLWDSELQCGDGARAYKHARITKSFRAGVSMKYALATVARSMNLVLPRNVSDATDLSRSFSAGLVMQGQAHKAMTQILAGTGYEWSIQDSRLQILKPAGLRTDQSAEVNAATGLIGTPTLGAPKKAKGKPVMSFRTLLYPSLTPGGRVDLKSRSVNGRFKIINVRHSGDTHGEAWYTDAEAEPI